MLNVWKFRHKTLISNLIVLKHNVQHVEKKHSIWTKWTQLNKFNKRNISIAFVNKVCEQVIMRIWNYSKFIYDEKYDFDLITTPNKNNSNLHKDCDLNCHKQ